MKFGSTPAAALETTRASGSRLSAFSTSSLTTMMALAPSLRGELLPAVTVPPLRKIGWSFCSASMVESARGPSSFATTMDGPFFCGIETSASSASNSPAACAFEAFWCEASANAS